MICCLKVTFTKIIAGQDWNTNPIVFTVKIRPKHTVKIRSKQCQNYLWISFLRCKRLRTGELTQVLNFVVNLFLSIRILRHLVLTCIYHKYVESVMMYMFYLFEAIHFFIRKVYYIAQLIHIIICIFMWEWKKFSINDS